MGCHPVVILQMWTGWGCYSVVICKTKWQPNDTQGHFGHFNMGTLGINFFMEVQEEGMGVEEEFIERLTEDCCFRTPLNFSNLSKIFLK